MYYLYILLCSDNSLYTGITDNLEKRFQKHNLGVGSKYVRSRLPFTCIHTEEFANRSKALKRESQIKSWNRAEKIQFLGLSS